MHVDGNWFAATALSITLDTISVTFDLAPASLNATRVSACWNSRSRDFSFFLYLHFLVLYFTFLLIFSCFYFSDVEQNRLLRVRDLLGRDGVSRARNASIREFF